jgi:hypothetical protein
MHRQRRTKDLTSGQLIVVSLLLLCFLSTSLSLSSLYSQFNKDAGRKPAHGWAKRDAQVPFEEKEKGVEEKSAEKHHVATYLLALIREIAQHPTRCLSTLHSNAHHESIPCLCGVPIYITHRTFLI